MGVFSDNGKELIPIAEYAKMHGKSTVNMKQKAQKGRLDTAVKVGRSWFVERDAPYVDKRYTTGAYVGWNRYRKSLRVQNDDAQENAPEGQQEGDAIEDEEMAAQEDAQEKSGVKKG